jgi:2-amino-4-hydroxy-6-hydroxymethyldihydropteridine pyrophosphokinase
VPGVGVSSPRAMDGPSSDKLREERIEVPISRAVVMIRAYVGLGSNLENPQAQIRRALAALKRLPRTRCVAVSSLYRSAPMGPPGQPDYINAVAALDTALKAEEMLDHLQAIEHYQGRIRGPQRWGPRIIDLDLLLYGDEQIATERLTVPHPGLHERSFVLYPLKEVDPGLGIPGRGCLDALLNKCPPDGLERLPGAR